MESVAPVASNKIGQIWVIIPQPCSYLWIVQTPVGLQINSLVMNSLVSFKEASKVRQQLLLGRQTWRRSDSQSKTSLHQHHTPWTVVVLLWLHQRPTQCPIWNPKWAVMLVLRLGSFTDLLRCLRNMHTIKHYDECDSSHIFKPSLDTGLAHHDRAPWKSKKKDFPYGTWPTGRIRCRTRHRRLLAWCVSRVLRTAMQCSPWANVVTNSVSIMLTQIAPSLFLRLLSRTTMVPAQLFPMFLGKKKKNQILAVFMPPESSQNGQLKCSLLS